MSKAQTQSKTGLTRGDVVRYVMLPGIRPRLAELFGRGFQYIPFFIAMVYQCVRLLPANHPYTNPQNMGRFGIRHVIAEAANHLVFTRKNIDQIAVFFLIILGMIIILMQIFLVSTALFIQPGFTFPANFGEFFVPNRLAGPGQPSQDLAMILLDMVFGVPDMFFSCVSTGVNCLDGNGNPITISTDVPGPLSGAPIENFATWPYPVHEGLHQLLSLYSVGMLVVAVFITMYFMAVVIAETAQTGTAFGKRFNKVWAPVRIVVAFGLLIPIAYGLNSGQYIVLYAAKFGSGFASNGWHYFNTTITNHYYNGVRDLVAEPNFPESNTLLQFFHVAAVCKYMYLRSGEYDQTDGNSVPDLLAYLIREPMSPPQHMALTPVAALAYGPINGTDTYEDMMNFMAFTTPGGHQSGSNRIIVRFGNYDEHNNTAYTARVKPLCGEITIDLQDSRMPTPAPPVGSEPGPEVLQRHYWFLIKALWHTSGQLNVTTGLGPPIPANQFRCHAVKHVPWLNAPIPGGTPNCSPAAGPFYPDEQLRNALIAEMADMFDAALISGGPPDNAVGQAAIPAQEASASWNTNPIIAAKGWAGAAIWYNKIAEMNGAVTSAVFNIPLPSKYPWLMEYTKEKRRQSDESVSFRDQFNPVMSEGREVAYQTPQDKSYAMAMYDAYNYWSGADMATTTQTQGTGNIIMDTINSIFGTNGLFEMRKNPDVHPLAQLVGVGRSLVEASIRNLGFVGIGGASGALMAALGADQGSKAMAILSNAILSIALVALTAGFILYYVVPFLPFIYFFFAVGGWVKGIFEAMVGVPLWALAHIRIDGNGLPGNAAMNGYFLIFEIFLRPILTLFGFIGSIIIFAAMVDALHDIFDLVVSNVGGFDMEHEFSNPLNIDFYRGAIDEFFFTVMYAVIVYMMAQSSFKLIDLVPNQILRWMGASVATFNDSRQDPTGNLVSTASLGANQATSSLRGGISGLINLGRGG